MPSTHTSLHYHVVFSTKNRERVINAEWIVRFHGYLGGCIKTAGGTPLSIGGVEDHVHVLAGLNATIAVAKFVQEIKQTSSKWVHESICVPEFAWQIGYGAFSVSAANLDGVVKYIKNQHEHHRVKTFQEEYLEFLKKSGVKYDERYLW